MSMCQRHKLESADGKPGSKDSLRNGVFIAIEEKGCDKIHMQESYSW